MKYQKMKLIDAHAYVKKRRPLIRPNAGFWKDLVDYERKLFHKNSVDMVESKLGKLIHTNFLISLLTFLWKVLTQLTLGGSPLTSKIVWR